MTDTRRDAPPRGAPEGRTPGAVPVVRMDPRIRRRRIEVRRDQGRHRLRLLAGCIGVVAAVALAFGVSRSPLFDVEYVDVRGTENTPRRLVIDAARLASRPAMVDVNTGAVVRRVKALPWVLQAAARRQWPGTVRIDITERRPSAALPAGESGWARADVTGRVLDVGPEKPAGLPVITSLAPAGPPGSEVAAPVKPALRVAAGLSEQLRQRVTDVAIVEAGNVELRLTPEGGGPGGVVRLGPPTRLRQKLSVLATILARADLTRVQVIDVRVPRAPALTRR